MRIVMLGDGGHAAALSQFVMVNEWITDDTKVEPDDQVVIGVGDLATRRKLFEKFAPRVKAVWAPGVWLPTSRGRGFQFLSGVIIPLRCRVGDNVLINTGAQIDHDCTIGDHCVIAPGAILCGGVTLGEACFVGAGAIIVEGVTLEPDTFVPAGTLVVGPSDFRMPGHVVRDRGAGQAAEPAPKLDTATGAAGHGLHPDPQPR